MNQRSIAFRLMLLYAGTLLLAGIGFSFFTVTSFEHYTHATLENVVSTRAHDIWNVIQGSLDNTTEFTELIERRFSPAAEDRFIRVSIGGRVIYRSGVPADRAFDPGTIALPSPAALPKTYQLKKLVIYTNRFVASDGVAVLIESGQTDISHGLETSLITSLAIGLPILLSIAAIGGYVLIRRALSPVERMIGAAEEITFNNSRNRLPLLGTADRIEALGLALNRMLDRLDNAYRHASRFSADAAHELRTPLSIIRAGLEFAITNHDLPSRTKDYLADLHDEATRLGYMAENLLTLTRMDSLWGKRNHTDMDLYLLVCEVVEQMSLIAEAQGVKLDKPRGGTVFVAGDRDRIKQAILNLLDNAIKYNREGGAVWVDVGTNADMAVITVSDSGIGIAPDSQEFIFDRFYRVAADRGATGTGLGLAIVHSICHAHGGSIDVRSILNEGSSFSIRLPLNATGTGR